MHSQNHIKFDMEMFMNSSNIKLNMASAQVTCIMCDAAQSKPHQIWYGNVYEQ